MPYDIYAIRAGEFMPEEVWSPAIVWKYDPATGEWNRVTITAYTAHADYGGDDANGAIGRHVEGPIVMAGRNFVPGFIEVPSGTTDYNLGFGEWDGEGDEVTLGINAIIPTPPFIWYPKLFNAVDDPNNAGQYYFAGGPSMVGHWDGSSANWTGWDENDPTLDWKQMHTGTLTSLLDVNGEAISNRSVALPSRPYIDDLFGGHMFRWNGRFYWWPFFAARLNFTVGGTNSTMRCSALYSHDAQDLVPDTNADLVLRHALYPEDPTAWASGGTLTWNPIGLKPIYYDGHWWLHRMAPGRGSGGPGGANHTVEQTFAWVLNEGGLDGAGALVEAAELPFPWHYSLGLYLHEDTNTLYSFTTTTEPAPDYLTLFVRKLDSYDLSTGTFTWTDFVSIPTGVSGASLNFVTTLTSDETHLLINFERPNGKIWRVRLSDGDVTSWLDPEGEFTDALIMRFPCEERLYLFNNFISNHNDPFYWNKYWQRNPTTQVWEKKVIPENPPWIESYWMHSSLRNDADGGDQPIVVGDRWLWRGLWVEGPLGSTQTNVGEWDQDNGLWIQPAPIDVGTIARAYPISIVPHYIDGHYYLVGEDVLHWDGGPTVTTIAPTPPSWAFRSASPVTDFTAAPISMIQAASIGVPTYLYCGVDYAFLLDGSYWFYSQGEYATDGGLNTFPPVLLGTPTRGAVLDDPSVLTGLSLYKIFHRSPAYVAPFTGPGTWWMLPKPWNAYMWLGMLTLASEGQPGTWNQDALYLMMDGTPRLDPAYTLDVPTVFGADNVFANFYVHPETNDVFVLRYYSEPNATVERYNELHIEKLTSYNLGTTPATFTWTELASWVVPVAQTQPRVTSDDQALYILHAQARLSNESKVYRVDMTSGAMTEETVEWTEDEGPDVVDSHFFRAGCGPVTPIPPPILIVFSFGTIIGL